MDALEVSYTETTFFMLKKSLKQWILYREISVLWTGLPNLHGGGGGGGEDFDRSCRIFYVVQKRMSRDLITEFMDTRIYKI